MGETKVSPSVSTIFFVIGVIGWSLLTWLIFNARVLKVRQQINQWKWVSQNGQLTDAMIMSKSVLRKNKDYSESIILEFMFDNFNLTPIQTKLNLVDSIPHLNRYEAGNMIKVRINTSDQVAMISFDGVVVVPQLTFGYGLTLFNMVFAVVVFFIYSYFSSEPGWYFMSPLNPWFIAPYLGILLFKMTGIIASRSTSKQLLNQQLFLHGLKSKAEITNKHRTGTEINNQPRIQISYNYVDETSQTHYHTIKKLVPIHEASRTNYDVLYLREDPSVHQLIEA